MTSAISTELEVMEELRRPAGDFARFVGMHLGKDGAEGANAFVEALLCFGRTERIAHAADRRRAAGLQPEAGADAAIKKFNSTGLLALADASAALRRAAAAAPTGAPKPEALAALNDAFADLKGFFADCEIKASDVGKLARALDEAAGIAARGEKAALDEVVAKLAELEAARRRPDRGDVDNIPLHKIIAIAVFLGLTVAVIVRCFRDRTKCNDVIQVALVAGMTIAALVIKFC
jgi:hypothetical protein